MAEIEVSVDGVVLCLLNATRTEEHSNIHRGSKCIYSDEKYIDTIKANWNGAIIKYTKGYG